MSRGCRQILKIIRSAARQRHIQSNWGGGIRVSLFREKEVAQHASTELTVELSECEERYQRNRDNNPHGCDPRQTPTAHAGKAFRQRLSLHQSDEELFHDVESDENDGEYDGLV